MFIFSNRVSAFLCIVYVQVFSCCSLCTLIMCEIHCMLSLVLLLVLSFCESCAFLYVLIGFCIVYTHVFLSRIVLCVMYINIIFIEQLCCVVRNLFSWYCGFPPITLSPACTWAKWCDQTLIDWLGVVLDQKVGLRVVAWWWQKNWIRESNRRRYARMLYGGRRFYSRRLLLGALAREAATQVTSSLGSYSWLSESHDLWGCARAR